MHDLILMTIIAKTRVFLNRTIIKWISVTAGFLLIGFAVYFAVEFFKSVFEIG
ncbi:putative membrane protein [Caldibacillus thermoamylovorans]|nr:putative membrane protein [Caldibacillus thermoamylovorans]